MEDPLHLSRSGLIEQLGGEPLEASGFEAEIPEPAFEIATQQDGD